MASMYKQNLKLKNIAYISSKVSRYNKLGFNLHSDDTNPIKRGKSNQYLHSNSTSTKQSQSSILKKKNEFSKTKRDSNSQTHSQSKKGFYRSQDIDEIIKGSTSFNSMFSNQYQLHKKTYSCLVTEANKKSNNTSSDYLLVTSPSTSSIGKNKTNALRNINVFYSELSKHLRRDQHNMSNRHTNSKSQIKLNTKHTTSNGNSNSNCNSNGNNDEQCHEIKVNSSKYLSHPQPSTQETKESSENNKKEKETNNLYMSQTRNINNDNSNSTNFQFHSPKNNYVSKNDNQSKMISNNDIDTPEELHYLYVNILQNGKEIEMNFDKIKENV